MTETLDVNFTQPTIGAPIQAAWSSDKAMAALALHGADDVLVSATGWTIRSSRAAIRLMGKLLDEGLSVGINGNRIHAVGIVS